MSCCGKVHLSCGSIGYIIEENQHAWKIRLESNVDFWIKRVWYYDIHHSYYYKFRSKSKKRISNFLPIRLIINQNGMIKLLVNRFSVDENNNVDYLNSS